MISLQQTTKMGKKDKSRKKKGMGAEKTAMKTDKKLLAKKKKLLEKIGEVRIHLPLDIEQYCFKDFFLEKKNPIFRKIS